MGECGCADGFGDLSLAGPNREIYTIRWAPACDYCDTPVGLLIDWHSASGSREMRECLHEIPQFTIPKMQFSDAFGGAAFPICDPRDLVKALRERGLLVGDEPDADVDDWLADVRGALNQASAETWSRWLKGMFSNMEAKQ